MPAFEIPAIAAPANFDLVMRAASLAASWVRLPAPFFTRKPLSAWLPVRMAETTFEPTATWSLLRLNVQPWTIAFPASSWMAGEPEPALSQSTKLHALAVNCPTRLRIQTQRSIGPQNEQFTRLTLPSAPGSISKQTELVLLQRPTNSPLQMSSPGGCACSTTTARWQESAPSPRKLPLALPCLDFENL